MAHKFLPRAGLRPLAGALGVVPLAWRHQSTSCEEKPKPQFVPATCVKNELHTHNVRKITLQLGSDWTQQGPIANVVVRAAVGGVVESGCCACCKCPQPCSCPKQANGCCACCKCPGTCGCPKKQAPAVKAEGGCCACCKCPQPCGCPKQANGCCACCKCPGTCGCPKKEAPAAKPESQCCACCKCPPPCSCPKQANGCCACCKCPGKCGCPKKEAPGATQIARPYNPVSSDSGNTVTLLVKKYENAKMGTKLHSLKEGESVEVRGPNQQWTFRKYEYKHYAMVAGGTGITPLVQATEYILKNDAARVTVCTFNKTPTDVLLQKELAALASQHPGRLAITHFVEGGDGYERAGCEQAERCCMPRVLKAKLPAPGEGVLVMVCGPKAMTEHVAGAKTPDFKQGEVDGVLKGLGYESKHVWKV